MGMQEFKSSVENAVRLISQQKSVEKSQEWLNEKTLSGIGEAGLESLPANLGFPIGAAAGRFRRIVQEVAEADGQIDVEQSVEAADSLKRIAEILKSLPTEFWNSSEPQAHRRAS